MRFTSQTVYHTLKNIILELTGKEQVSISSHALFTVTTVHPFHLILTVEQALQFFLLNDEFAQLQANTKPNSSF